MRTGDCDVCGEPDGFVETLELDRGDSVEPWRVGRVCPECRDGSLMPLLRHFFEGTPWLDEPHGDGIEIVTPNPPHRFFSFAKPGRETVHVARHVFTGPALGVTPVCVGACGIDARVDPEPRSLRLSARKEGIIVCARCARFAPERVEGAQVC